MSRYLFARMTKIATKQLVGGKSEALRSRQIRAGFKAVHRFEHDVEADVDSQHPPAETKMAS